MKCILRLCDVYLLIVRTTCGAHSALYSANACTCFMRVFRCSHTNIFYHLCSAPIVTAQVIPIIEPEDPIVESDSDEEFQANFELVKHRKCMSVSQPGFG